MNIEEEEKLRKDFTDILEELFKKQDEINFEELYLKLENLYSKNKFRHFYSDIFFVLSLKPSNNMDMLSANLEYIKNHYNETESDIKLQINKFYDHVNLEISRISFFGRSYEEINNKFLELDKREKELKEDYKSLKDKIDNSQKEYIAILGIFSAVVLSFFGDFSFSKSIFENFNKDNVKELLEFSIISGFVLINILYFLFGFIRDLTGKEKTNKINIIIFDLLLIILFILA